LFVNTIRICAMYGCLEHAHMTILFVIPVSLQAQSTKLLGRKRKIRPQRNKLESQTKKYWTGMNKDEIERRLKMVTKDIGSRKLSAIEEKNPILLGKPNIN
jgi:hypothetical protein